MRGSRRRAKATRREAEVTIDAGVFMSARMAGSDGSVTGLERRLDRREDAQTQAITGPNVTDASVPLPRVVRLGRDVVDPADELVQVALEPLGLEQAEPDLQAEPHGRTRMSGPKRCQTSRVGAVVIGGSGVGPLASPGQTRPVTQ